VARETSMNFPSHEFNLLSVEIAEGKLREIRISKESLAEGASFEPKSGVYTVDRTYPGERVLCMERHFDRLESSAEREGIPVQLDRAMIRRSLHGLVRESGFGDVRFRISIDAEEPEVIHISLERFRPVPGSLRAEGVQCALMAIRRPHPEAKTLGWMHQRGDTPIPEGAYEGLLISPTEEILEGYTSNVYAIVDGTLRTAEVGVLHGISRYIVLQVAPSLLPVRLDPILVSDLPRTEEAFLTSSTRGIIPIVSIDGRAIGTGKVGPRTRELTLAYSQWVEAHLEPLVPDEA
jgi:branched-chain amino acid aminotransferase